MFGNLGKMAGLMKDAMKIQENIQRVKDEISEIEVIGRSVDELVEVVSSGDLKIKEIKIDPELINSGNPELIADSIAGAVNEVIGEVKSHVQDRVRQMTGGIDIPGLF